MAYIYLEELEKILPDILDQWIDRDDESWEWIFQEIEQKCHVGKKKKDKKPKKNAMEIAIMAHRNDINELNDKFNKLNDICNAHTVRLDRISQDITAVKSMAQTAMCRTEVDYTKCSQKNKEKYDQPITVASKCGSCKHLSKQPIEQPCIGCCYNGMNISGMDKWEAKDE